MVDNPPSVLQEIIMEYGGPRKISPFSVYAILCNYGKHLAEDEKKDLLRLLDCDGISSTKEMLELDIYRWPYAPLEPQPPKICKFNK